jgi:hypothetical protein
MVTRQARPRKYRSDAENRIYAQIARAGLSRDQELKAAASMRAGRRLKIADRLDPDRQLPVQELEDRIDAEIRLHLLKARAKSLTSRRKLRELQQQLDADEEQSRQLDAELDATGLDDAGSDGVDAA